LAHGIEINALTFDGSDGATLSANWSWAPALVDAAAVRALAEGWFAVLERLARHAAQPGAGGLSPSDLALVDLTQDEIERLERHTLQLEDVLPLAPLQEGLLFHALYDAGAAERGPDVYTVQLALDLEGALDITARELAAQALIGRHAPLGAGFWSEGLRQPVQVIARKALPAWRHVDLSALSEDQRAERVAAIVAEERRARFDLTAPPLMRFALLTLG